MKLNSCVVGVEELDDHVKVKCVDGTEYKVNISDDMNAVVNKNYALIKTG